MIRYAFLAVLAALVGCSTPKTPADNPQAEAPAPALPRPAPERYTVRLETTKGEVLLDVVRAWAPLGADRFHELVTAGFYDGVAFFRVVPGFMAQVGISGDPRLNLFWRARTLPDDPVTQSNTRGRVTFATAGPGTRTTQVFINFGDNSRLDGMGFAPFGQVRDMAVVDALFGGYGEGAPRGRGPDQQRLQTEGNRYLRETYPQLDYILRATVIP